MNYEKAEQALLKGSMIRRESWKKKNRSLYYISHNELCAAFEYGYGEHYKEPKFAGKIAHIDKNNHIHIGYKVKKKDRVSGDWEVCGIWKK